MADFDWSQPICAWCYDKRHPRRVPYHLTDPMREVCCDCGNVTGEGIYVRVDPATVDHPTRLKDDP